MISSPVPSPQTKKRRLPGKKTRTLEEKITFQTNQLTLLKEKLVADLYGIEQSLVLGNVPPLTRQHRRLTAAP